MRRIASRREALKRIIAWAALCGRVDGRTTDADVGETVIAHDGRRVEIASVDDDGKLERAVEPVEVERGKLLPLSENDDGVGTFGGGVGIVGEGERVGGGQNALGGVDGGGVTGSDGDSGIEQAADERDGRRVARVIGVGFEGETEGGDLFAAKGPKGGADFLEEEIELVVVDLADFAEEVKIDALLLGDPGESSDILGKTGAAITQTGAQETRADARVQAHAEGDVFDVGIDGFGEVGDGVDEGDFHGEKCIGGVLDDLRALRRGDDERSRLGGGTGTGQSVGLGIVCAGGERRVDAAEQRGGTIVVGSDDDAVGVKEIADGGAFAKKLGVGDDVEMIGRNAVTVHAAGDPLVGVDGNSAFFDEDFIAVHGLCNLADDSLDVGEIGGAGAALRRADGDKDSFRGMDAGGKIGGEGDATVQMPGEHLRQMSLEDGSFSALKLCDFGFVVVHADDAMAHLCKADGGDEADISGTDDTDGDRRGCRGNRHAG